MKKIFSTSLLAMIFLSVNAQHRFTGIGIFKIGCDTSVVYSFAKSLDVDVLPLTKESDYYDLVNENNSNQILDQQSDLHVFKVYKSINDGQKYLTVSNCIDVTEYFLNEYQISGIDIYNVRLKFYKNKLVSFSSNFSNKIIEAITKKYGPPKKSFKTGSLGHCVLNEKSRDFWYKWVNANIRITAFTMFSYDTDCKTTMMAAFDYAIENKSMNDCENPNKKQSLSDF